MQASVVDKDQIILVGFSFFGDPFEFSGGWTEENEIGRLWQRFMDFGKQHQGQIKHLVDPQASYEVHVYNPETQSKGHFEVFVGMEVSELSDVPVELLVKVLPPNKYAIFTLKSEQITSDWSKEIFQDWFPQSGYQPAGEYGIQLYDQRFKGLDQVEESELDVYIPVK